MKALNVKINNESEGIIVLCSCGNIINVDPKELKLLDKMILQCQICKAEILIKRDNDICSGQDL